MPRLTPERTAEADAIAHFYPAVERDINRNLIMSARVLDLLDAIDERIEVERRTVATLTARAEQAEKRLDEYTSITTATEPPTERTIPSDELQRAIDAARAMSRLDECDSDERIKRVNALRADWPQYAQFDHQTFLALVFAVYMASVVDALEDEVEKRRQAERDRDALAAVVRAWGQHDISDPMVRGECYRELQERLTDASGALQRAKGGA